jgi:hypothetical protein
MSKKTLSRRDAIKLLGAATGATLLANLPSKWSTPELTSGVLPAHAQTSTSLGLQIIDCNFSLDLGTGAWSSTPFVGLPIPSSPGIGMCATFSFVNTHFEGGSDPQSPNPIRRCWVLDVSTGTVTVATNNFPDPLLGRMLPDAGATSGSVTVLWEFASPEFGSGSCSSSIAWAT